MELAKITSKGQITIPKDIRVKMNLRAGDRILFLEKDDKFFLQNSNSIALTDFQKKMEGAAEKSGLKNPDDVVKYIKKLRKTAIK